MNSKNNRTSPLCYVKLCPLFQSRQWIQTEVIVRKCSIQAKIAIFCPRDFQTWWMTLKKIGHLFYATSSVVHHFVPIGQFISELQSGNTEFGWKSAILFPIWPWNSTGDLKKINKRKQNNRTPILCHFKLCQIFRSHQSMQTEVTFRKRPIRFKIGNL